MALAHRRFEEDLRHRGHSSASGGICGGAPSAFRHLTHSHTYSGSGTFSVLPSALYPHRTLSQTSFHKSGSRRAALPLSSHPHKCGSLLTVPFPPVARWSFRASLHCGNFLSAQGSHPQPPLALWQSCCPDNPSSLLYLCPFAGPRLQQFCAFLALLGTTSQPNHTPSWSSGLSLRSGT